MNTAQTAFYLGISEKTLKMMRAKGIGPPFHRYGRSIRYHIDEVIAWSKATAQGLAAHGNGDQLCFDFMTSPVRRRHAKHP